MAIKWLSQDSVKRGSWGPWQALPDSFLRRNSCCFLRRSLNTESSCSATGNTLLYVERLGKVSRGNPTLYGKTDRFAGSWGPKPHPRRGESGRFTGIGNLLYCPAWPECDPLSECSLKVPSRPCCGSQVEGSFTSKRYSYGYSNPDRRTMIPPFGCCLRRLFEKAGGLASMRGRLVMGVEAIEGVERFKPDVVVMDLAMPVMKRATSRPRKSRKPTPGCRCLLISVPGSLQATGMGSSQCRI